MGGSEGGRNDRERRRERGWREGKVLQLYPELQGSQEFHPWKSFFLSLSGKFCKHFSTQLLFTNISTFHAVLHMKTDSTLQSYALFFSLSLSPNPPPTTRVARIGPATSIFSKAGRPNQVSSTGVAGVIAWRKWPRPECMAADTTRHVASDSLTLSLLFLSLSSSVYLSSFYRF